MGDLFPHEGVKWRVFWLGDLGAFLNVPLPSSAWAGSLGGCAYYLWLIRLPLPTQLLQPPRGCLNSFILLSHPNSFFANGLFWSPLSHIFHCLLYFLLSLCAPSLSMPFPPQCMNPKENCLKESQVYFILFTLHHIPSCQESGNYGPAILSHATNTLLTWFIFCSPPPQ